MIHNRFFIVQGFFLINPVKDDVGIFSVAAPNSQHICRYLSLFISSSSFPISFSYLFYLT